MEEERYNDIFNKLIKKLEKVPINKWKCSIIGQRNAHSIYSTQLGDFEIKLKGCINDYYEVDIILDKSIESYELRNINYSPEKNPEFSKLIDFGKTLHKNYSKFKKEETLRLQKEKENTEKNLSSKKLSDLESFLNSEGL